MSDLSRPFPPGEAHYALAVLLAAGERWNEAESAALVAFQHDPRLAHNALTETSFAPLRRRMRFWRQLHKSLVQAGLL